MRLRNCLSYSTILFSLISFFGCGYNQGPSDHPQSYCSESESSIFPCNDKTVRNILSNIRNETVFNSTNKIKILPYKYFDTNRFYYVSGDSILSRLISIDDCCSLLKSIDEYSNEPIFEWDNIENKLIAIGIFTEPISVTRSSITNINSIIWTWNNSIKPLTFINGKPQVKFMDGVPVQNGLVQYNKVPDPLDGNKVYYWSIWAWNESGSKVVASSIAIPFRVGDFSYQINEISSINGYWVLSEIDHPTFDTINTNNFEIKTFSISGDCREFQYGINKDSIRNKKGNYLDINILSPILKNYDIDSISKFQYFPCDQKLVLDLFYKDFIPLTVTFKRMMISL